MRAKMLLPSFVLLIGSQAVAQSTPPKVHLGASFIVAEPQQEFGNYVSTSLGGSINALWTPQPESALGIRFEGGVINYGHETQRIPFSSRANRVDVRQTTSNMMAFVHAGPQFTWMRGPVRPYVAPSAGLTYIATMT